MRVRIAFGAWWLVLTLAWMAAALPWDTGGGPADAAFWWQLRQHALYLSGFWAIGMMSLGMLLSLRQHWLEPLLGGMDQVYRLHKWLGIGAAVAAVLHWGAKESSGLIKDVWGTAGRPARDAVLAWAVDWRGTAKDVGEWAFYALLVMVVLTLWQRLLPYRPWRRIHRVMPALYLMLAFHTLALMPLAFWSQPIGVCIAGLLCGHWLGGLAVGAIATPPMCRPCTCWAHSRAKIRWKCCAPCLRSGAGTSPVSLCLPALKVWKGRILLRSPARLAAMSARRRVNPCCGW